MPSNIRGLDSKTQSLSTILNIVQPSVFTINETLYKGNRKVKIGGFSSFEVNRSSKDGGGIATCVEQTSYSQSLRR